MAKRKKTFFEKLTELNDSYEDRQKKLKTNRRKRNRINIAILSALGVCVVAGISIPLAINTTKVNYIQPKSDNEVILEQRDNDKVVNKVNVGEITKLLSDPNHLTNQKIDDLYRRAIFYFYNEEVKASKQYQNLYNNSLSNDESLKSDIELKSLNKIRLEKRQILNDDRNNIEKNYPYDTFETTWNKKLQSDEYGHSKNIDEAVEYLTFKEVENEAKRRFSIEAKVVDLKDIKRNATRDIDATDENGNPIKDASGNQKILFKQGENVLPYYQENKTYFIDSKQPNKAVIFTTKSYVADLKDPSTIIAKYFSKNNINIATTVLLPGVVNNDLTLPFSFDKDNAKEKLINILKYTVTKNTDSNVTFSQNIDFLKNISDAVYNTTLQSNETLDRFNRRKRRFEFYLNNLTLTKPETLATNGIQSYDDMLNQNVDLALAAQSSTLFETQTTKLPEIDLNEIFKLPSGINPERETIIQSKLQQAQTLVTKNNPNDGRKITNLIEEVNKNIEILINSMTAQQFSDYVRARFNDNFNVVVHSTDKYLSFAYRVKNKPDFLIIPTEKGLMLYKNQEITSLDQFKTFIKTDLENLLLGNNTNFKITDKLSLNPNKEQLLVAALSDQGFVNELLKTTNPFSPSKQTENFKQSDLDAIKENVLAMSEGSVQTKFISDIEKVNKWIKDTYNKKNSLNIAFDKTDAKLKIAYFDKSNQQFTYSSNNAFDLIQNTLRSQLQKGEK
ncbi:hypothetical protein BCF59_0180 [Mycoplasmopsis mustelae]|uniref:Membrane protein P80 n=1 Tax=Mycoplasmopsis mustelae TaxID=171289 RepID=A0A4R7UCR6_9BACT|nr:hypothetical protein [Mycoplasmopsis mustelae]TDV24228.1 hypothetical protein BCF59_0180 [Mycoplasmopsis mustelae]